MPCPRCRHDNPAGNKFCGECGTALPAAPPLPPRTAAPPLERFASVESYTPRHLADKILVSRASMEGERKQVTVLFTDVSGFTAMSERLDPEDVHAIMDRVFEVILATVHRYEGTVNQFLGDGVMALFGAPIAHEDHAHRALRAALEMQTALQPVREETQRAYSVDIRVRMGINSGLVVVGAIGRDLRMDYTAVGDTTNLAARILNIAQPGQCALSAQTWRLTDGFFDFQSLGMHAVKGKTDPVAIYAVLREKHGRTRLEVSMERGLTPLVGRAGERRRLLEAFARARDGAGAAIAVAGEPGVGKSRILYEFLRELDSVGADVDGLETTCVSHGQSMPYHPILALVRRALGVVDAATEDEIRSRIRHRLESLALDGDEGTTLLAHFLGLPVPLELLARYQGPQLKEKTNRLICELLGSAAPSRVTVIVIENVHWADPSSVELIRALVERVTGSRTLLVLSTRLGSTTGWPVSPGVTTITLQGLQGDDARGMVQTLLGADAVSDDVMTMLLDKSEGNPLYMEEIIHQLRETGALVVSDGHARLSVLSVTVPETIHDLIAARIDRLVDPLKHTIQVASVVGRQFVVPLLIRVVGGTELHDRVRNLEVLDFVFLARRDPDLLYSFKHALTQEVVYRGLLERRRRVYHAAIGLALEELHAERIDDVAELLAYHFSRSGADEKAVDYAIRAAEKAQRRWAHAETLAHFESALERLATMPLTEANERRRIDAVVKQGEIKFALGRHAEHVQALESIKDTVDRVADAPRRAAWYGWAGFLHSLTGTRPEVSIAYCGEASRIADAEGFDDLRAFADCALAHVSLVAGHLSGVIEKGERALAFFAAGGNVWWACRALFALSPAANALGEWARSLEYCGRIVEYGRLVDDLRLKVVGAWRTGVTHIYRGDPLSGIRCCDEALALSPAYFDRAMTRAVRGYGLIKAGHVALGVAELTEMVAWFDQSHLRYTRSLFALWLAEGWLLQDERDRARGLIEDVLRTSRDIGYRHLEGVAGRLLAEAIEPAAVPAVLGSALARLREVGARNDYAKALVADGRRLAALGQVAAGAERLDEAEALFAVLGTIDGPHIVAAARTYLAPVGRVSGAPRPRPDRTI